MASGEASILTMSAPASLTSRIASANEMPLRETCTPSGPASPTLGPMSRAATTTGPFVAVTTDQARALFESAQATYERLLAKHNQKLLYPSPWPPTGIWAKRPISTPETLNRILLDQRHELAQQGADAARVSVDDAFRLECGDKDFLQRQRLARMNLGAFGQ